MTGDWRTALSPRRRGHLRLWLAAGASLTFAILVIGGVTRLTQSGLSIVDWKPVMGVIPPLNHEQWLDAFGRYQGSPEYQQLRRGMSLAEFRTIFYWEYSHRLAARLLGLVFLVPFAFFWVRGYFSRPLLARVLVLFGLGALQGFMGWFMVRSGLVDRPSVSHYRLAAHLTLALTILAACAWLRWELRPAPPSAPPGRADARSERRWVHLIGAVLFAQILWGAFVAGLDAGLYFNTFPLMGGRLVPPGGLSLEPALRNLVANPILVQWIHRVLGTLLLVAALLAAAHAWRAGADRASRRLSAAFAVLVLAQYALGVVTLLLFVPVSVGALHQAGAVVVFVVWLKWLHLVHTRRRLREDSLAGSRAGAPERETAALPG